MIPNPSILELLDASRFAVRGEADKNADFIRGSDYEALLGPSAIVWSREAFRDTDLFNAVNFHTADGDDLTRMGLQRYGFVRNLDTRGTGAATLVRPAGGVTETIWAGTRITLTGSQQKSYRVTADTPVPSANVQVTVPIEAVDTGLGAAVSVANSPFLRIDDQLLYPSWQVSTLNCTDGGVFEKADAFRVRIRQSRLDARVGQSKAIIAACNAVGATNVALFRSDYAGDDFDAGLNVCYVGDLSNSSTPELVKACTLALRAVRVGGDHLQVLPMARVDLPITADVYLSGSPASFDIPRLIEIHSAGIRQYLNGSAGRFLFSLDGIRGAIALHTPAVQRVVLTNPVADATAVYGPSKSFPDVLNRYVVSSIDLRYLAI